jgi:hypothetical protein
VLGVDTREVQMQCLHCSTDAAAVLAVTGVTADSPAGAVLQSPACDLL